MTAAEMADLDARLHTLSQEEFAALIYRLTMRAGGTSPKGALVIVRWDNRTDAHMLLPTGDDPSHSAEVMADLKEAAASAVDGVLDPECLA